MSGPSSPAIVSSSIGRHPADREGASPMNGQDVTETTASTSSTARRACLVDGCTCKDARIVSTRRASYFASVAIARGETADRMVRPDPTWVLPIWSEPGPEAAAVAELTAQLAAHLDAAA
jgi:hypothetical protein